MKNPNAVIAIYRDRARNRANTSTDTLIYAIARAYKYVESEGEAGYLATKFMFKAFLPTTNKNKLQSNQNHDAYFKLNEILANLALDRFPEFWKASLETEDLVAIRKMAIRLAHAAQRHYLYIFVRQDLCAEQQAVQAGHATFVAGATIAKDVEGNAKRPQRFNPNHTHFVLIGVPDLDALLKAHQLAVNSLNAPCHEFYEGDLDDEMTAFTTGIVTQENRHYFREYDLLKFRKD